MTKPAMRSTSTGVIQRIACGRPQRRFQQNEIAVAGDEIVAHLIVAIAPFFRRSRTASRRRSRASGALGSSMFSFWQTMHARRRNRARFAPSPDRAEFRRAGPLRRTRASGLSAIARNLQRDGTAEAFSDELFGEPAAADPSFRRPCFFSASATSRGM